MRVECMLHPALVGHLQELVLSPGNSGFAEALVNRVLSGSAGTMRVIRCHPPDLDMMLNVGQYLPNRDWFRLVVVFPGTVYPGPRAPFRRMQLRIICDYCSSVNEEPELIDHESFCDQCNKAFCTPDGCPIHQVDLLWCNQERCASNMSGVLRSKVCSRCEHPRLRSSCFHCGTLMCGARVSATNKPFASTSSDDDRPFHRSDQWFADNDWYIGRTSARRCEDCNHLFCDDCWTPHQRLPGGEHVAAKNIR